MCPCACGIVMFKVPRTRSSLARLTLRYIIVSQAEQMAACYDPRNFRVIAPAYLSANKAVCPTAI